jgi:hypothetical protein
MPDVNAHDCCLGDRYTAPQQIYVAYISVSSKLLIYYKYFNMDHPSVHWKPKLRLSACDQPSTSRSAPSFSLGAAAVSAGAPESELTRHLKEMKLA